MSRKLSRIPVTKIVAVMEQEDYSIFVLFDSPEGYFSVPHEQFEKSCIMEDYDQYGIYQAILKQCRISPL